MKIVTFNVNGIRARLHQLEQLVADHRPDIIGLQEVKVADDQFPTEAIQALGYSVATYGQKGHYGVATLSRKPPETVSRAFPGDPEDAQRRLITTTHNTSQGPLTIINGYFPQGENRAHELKFPAKQKFYADLLNYLQKHFSPTQNLIVMGDFNISPEDLDIGIGEENRKRWLRTGKCSFLPEEREWLQNIMAFGLFDTFRKKHPDQQAYSWFDYRSRGFERDPKRGLRIDYLLATRPMLDRCIDTEILYGIRAMEKPSDHCPVLAEFDGQIL